MMLLYRRQLLLAALAPPALWLTGCGSAPLGASRSPDIRGTITTVTLISAPAPAAGDPSRPVSSADKPTRPEPQPAGGSAPGRLLLVEGVREADTTYARAAVRVTAATRLFEGASRRPATIEALTAGQRVEVWFTGPVAESEPVQAVAEEVVIIR